VRCPTCGNKEACVKSDQRRGGSWFKMGYPRKDADWEETAIIVAGSNEHANKEPREHPCPCSIGGRSPLA
jgi:hypothetical protein